MAKRLYFLLFLLGVFVLLPVMYFQTSPGYMDADYYFAGAVRLSGGYGFSELIIWNYLDDPTGLPHPSHGYWMPLASIVAVIGMFLVNDISFSAAKLGFLLIAGLLPPITAVLAYSFHANREKALFSGILSAFPVFYLAYLGTTDTFAIYMFLGAIWFLILGAVIKNAKFEKKSNTYNWYLFIGLGLVSGLMHLARADGLLWLLLGLLSIVMIGYKRKKPIVFARRYVMPILVFILGYLLVMGPWMIRNLSEFGTPLAPGGIRTLWLIEYNDIYTYPASTLTFQRWWSAGFRSILGSRVFALGQNLQTSLVVQGGIFLAPLILLGMLRLRNDTRVKIGFIAWVATLFIMTFVFTEAGWRGGFFHSGAALQPLFWAMVPVGFESFVEWGVRVRGWDLKRAKKGFGIILLGVVGILTVFITWRRVIGEDFNNPAWDRTILSYTILEAELRIQGAKPEDVVLINNAPGYFVANGRAALSIPNGDEKILLNMANRYNARYMLLDENYPVGLHDLFHDPRDRPGYKYLGDVDNTKIYIIGG